MKKCPIYVIKHGTKLINMVYFPYEEIDDILNLICNLFEVKVFQRLDIQVGQTTNNQQLIPGRQDVENRRASTKLTAYTNKPRVMFSLQKNRLRCQVY